MGNHRADVEPSARPSEPLTPYVGRRRALPAQDVVVETAAPTPYVGKRRAAVAEPVSAPTMTTAVRSTPDGMVQTLPTTGELQLLVQRSLDETAPHPRMSIPVVEPARPTRAPRPADTLPRLDVPLPRRAPAEVPSSSALVFTEDSRIDIPMVGRPAEIAGDQTVTMPLVTPAAATGRRRAEGARTGRRRRFPSLPILAGVASIAAVVTGVVTTGHASLAPASSQHLVEATALSGFTGSGSVGGGHQSLSRGGVDRNNISSLLKLRNQALQQGNKMAGAYDDQLAKNLWVLPVQAGVYHLTGRFGDVSGLWRTVHTGLDFACATGTPIHAIANGTITFVGWDGAYGNKTVETLADGTEIWYAHQNAFGTQVGATVRQGEVIGYVGSTGNTTGPHVHIEVRPGGGDPVDPDPAFKEHGVDPDANQ